MKFGPRRGNFLIVFDKFLRNFGLLLFYLIMFFAIGTEIFTDNFFLLIVALVSPLWKLISYLTTFYTIDEQSLIIEKGILTKKKIEIPVSAITTVDLSQDILYQFFNVYKIKIDNASQINDTVDKAEASFALRREDAFLVKDLLTGKIDEPSTHKVKKDIPYIKAPVRNFFLLGLMQSKILYFLTFVPVISTVSALILTEEMDKSIVKIFNTAVNTFGAATLAAFGTIAVYLISLILSIIISIVTYIDFTAFNTGDSITVEYGLLNKKKYTLLKSKINGIALRQSVLMRMFGYCAVEIFVIGYGDKSNEENKEEAMLYPLIKKSDVPMLLSGIIPEFSLPQYISHPTRKGLRYFFMSYYFIGAVILLAFFSFIGNFYAIAGAIILVITSFIAVLFEYRTTGVSGNKDNITFITGAFTKRTTIVKTEAVESVSCITSILKGRKGIGHIKIGFLAPMRVAKTKVRNVEISEYEKIKGLIRY